MRSSKRHLVGAEPQPGRRLVRRVALGAALVTVAVWAAGVASLRVIASEDQYGRLVAVTARIPALAGRIEALGAAIGDPRTDPSRVDRMCSELEQSSEQLRTLSAAMAGTTSSDALGQDDARLLQPVLAQLKVDFADTVAEYADAAHRAAQPGAVLSPGSLLRGNLDGEYPSLIEQSQRVDSALRSAAQGEQRRWTQLVTAAVVGLGVIGIVLVALAMGPLGALLRRHRERERELDEARQDAAAHIAQLVDGVDVAVVAVNADGSQLTVNAAARELFGLPATAPVELDDVLSGAQLRSNTDGRPLPTGRQPLATALHGEQTSGEFTLVLHAGGPGELRRQVAVHARPLVSPDGRTLGAIMTLHDLTDLHTRNRALARHAQQLDAIGRATAAVLRVEDARSAVCSATMAVSGAVVANLFEPDGRGDLVCTAAEGADLVGMRMPIAGRSVMASTFASATACTTQDLAGHPEADLEAVARLSQLCNRPITAAVWVPVIDRGRCVAVLTAGFAGDDPVADHLPPLEILAAEAAFAMDRQTLLRRLALEAERDGLTGAANRRTWESRLPQSVEHARRTTESLAVVMLDIDHFKAFNDQHGHPAGDELLRQAVTSWQQRLRPGDLLARYGGEEFVVLLPGCTVEGARAVADDLRSLMPQSTTCSAGVAVWDGEEPPHRLVSRADTALYQAKNAGRNQSALADSPCLADPVSG